MLSPFFIKASASFSSNDPKVYSSSAIAFLAEDLDCGDAVTTFCECAMAGHFTGVFRREAAFCGCLGCSAAGRASGAIGTSEGGVGGAF